MSVYLVVVKLGGDLTAESSTDDEPTSKVSKVWLECLLVVLYFSEEKLGKIPLLQQLVRYDHPPKINIQIYTV